MSSPSLSSVIPRHIADAISEHFKRIRVQEEFSPDSADIVASPQARDEACIRASEAFQANLHNYVEALHSDLRFAVNTRTRINQLPEDVLIHILSALPIPQLIATTHVCHRWRKLGLSTPSLWTQLELTDWNFSLGRAEAVLERSKAAAIDIVLDYSSTRADGDDKALTSLIESHLSHVRSLTIPTSRPPICSLTFRPLLPPDHLDFNQFVRRRESRITSHRTPVPAPRLEILRIDESNSITSAFSLDGGERPSFTCPGLRELYLADCFTTLSFLDDCRQLRVLDLHIPFPIAGRDVLGILRRNPGLRTVKLWIPYQWSIQDTGRDNTPLLPDVQHFSLGEYSTGNRRTRAEAQPSLVAAVRFFISHVNATRIPVLEVVIPSLTDSHHHTGTTGSDSADSAHRGRDVDTLYQELIAHLHGITTVDLSRIQRPGASTDSGRDEIMLLSFTDARGFVRTLSPGPSTCARPLELAQPFLATGVRVLRMGLKAWVALAEQHPEILELPALEELELRGLLADFASMPRGGVACPRLQRLSLLIRKNHKSRSKLHAASDLSLPPLQADSAGPEAMISIGKTVALDRLRSCPKPLQFLELVCEAKERLRLETRAICCSPPEPASVHLAWIRGGGPSPEDLSDSDSPFAEGDYYESP